MPLTYQQLAADEIRRRTGKDHRTYLAEARVAGKSWLQMERETAIPYRVLQSMAADVGLSVERVARFSDVSAVGGRRAAR